MQDLNIIRKLNAEAFGPEIASLQRQGKHVVATYTGLTLLKIDSFDDPLLAGDALNASVESPDINRKIFRAKYEAPNSFTRDRTEDRTVAEV